MIQSKYNSLSEWRKNHPTAYQHAYNNNWIQEICETFGWTYKPLKFPLGFWTKEKCREDALRYKTVKNWKMSKSGSHSIARNNGWVKELSTHMIPIHKPESYYTKEVCFSIGKKYKTRNEWVRKNPRSFTISKKNGWLNDCCTHMEHKKSKHYDK